MEKNNFWSSAALNGIYLSLVTIIYLLVTSVFNLNTLVNVLLQIIKIGLIVYLLYYFIKDYSNNFETFSYGEGFKYGFAVCLFSSLICACYGYLSAAVLFKEKTIAQFEMTMNSLGNSITPDVENMLSFAMENIGVLTLFSSLAYYIFMGIVFPAIIANFTKKENIFINSQN
jgi:hypothetical protein